MATSLSRKLLSLAIFVTAAFAMHSPSTALAADGLFSGLFVKKERSLVNVSAGLTFFREKDSYPDPVLGLQLNVAPSRYFNVELGAGGYHERIPEWLWNDFFSYVVAGVGYMFTTMSGEHEDFHDLRDPLLITVRNKTNSYTNRATWGGLYVVPFPKLRYQPQIGFQIMNLRISNKGSNLRSSESSKIYPTLAIEKRDEDQFSGLRVYFGPRDSDGNTLYGMGGYLGLNL